VNKGETPTLDKYLTVKEAAQMLGVSPSTLRNWDRSGKLRAKRHPVNRYRLYDRAELEALLHRLETRG
jgi:excisionase family DNA binding protein